MDPFRGAVLTRTERRLATAGIAAVAIAFLVRVVTLAQPLLEAHSFRQTQTAYTAVIYHREGIDLLQTPLPVFGPPWVVPFEFPLFQAIASLVMDLGVQTEVALRATSLAFFVVSTVLVFLIVELERDRRTAFVAVVAFVLAPLGLLWSRTSTIETLAVAASLGAVYEALRWDHSGSRLDFGLAIGLGMLAALLKVTTAVVWLLPALILLRRSRSAAWTIVGATLATGLAWTVYTDSIKAASPATAFLTSSALRDWNFGTLAMRFDGTFWLVLLSWFAGLGIVVIVAPFVVRGSRLGWWALASTLLGPLVFMNLYVQHDYYWMAVAPGAAILIALVVDAFRRTEDRATRQFRLAAVAALFALSFLAYPRWIVMFQSDDPDGVMTAATQIRAQTAPTDLVAISQQSWSPAVLFYADRRGYMEYLDGPPPPPGFVVFECPTPGLPGDCVRGSPDPAP